MVEIEFPGLLKEPLPSGNFRYRVRVEGDKTRRIALSVTPGHPHFVEHYLAARAGEKLEPKPAPKELEVPRSIGWLTQAYLEALQLMVDADIASPLTLKQRASHLAKFAAHERDNGKTYGKAAIAIPQTELVKFRDTMIDRPGAADNMIKSVRAMYVWACEHGHAKADPTQGVAKINKGSRGAIPWTVEYLHQFRKVHPSGTTAHLALTLFMFTACRISDGFRLGRENEIDIDGVKWLSWQPAKKGSAKVVIPMLPPLLAATRHNNVIGRAYLLTQHGRPFRSASSFNNRFRKWCHEAKIFNRSTHGVRKAAGELLAEFGCSQYEIMAVHGHTQAKTSEIYTKGVQRRELARAAMERLKGMEW